MAIFFSLVACSSYIVLRLVVSCLPVPLFCRCRLRFVLHITQYRKSHKHNAHILPSIINLVCARSRVLVVPVMERKMVYLGSRAFHLYYIDGRDEFGRAFAVCPMPRRAPPSIAVQCTPSSRFQDSKRNSTQAKPVLSLEWACVCCAAPKTLPRSHPYVYLPIQMHPELRQTCNCVTEMKKTSRVGEEGDVKSASKPQQVSM